MEDTPSKEDSNPRPLKSLNMEDEELDLPMRPLVLATTTETYDRLGHPALTRSPIPHDETLFTSTLPAETLFEGVNLLVPARRVSAAKPGQGTSASIDGTSSDRPQANSGWSAPGTTWGPTADADSLPSAAGADRSTTSFSTSLPFREHDFSPSDTTSGSWFLDTRADLPSAQLGNSVTFGQESNRIVGGQQENDRWGVQSNDDADERLLNPEPPLRGLSMNGSLTSTSTPRNIRPTRSFQSL